MSFAGRNFLPFLQSLQNSSPLIPQWTQTLIKMSNAGGFPYLKPKLEFYHELPVPNSDFEMWLRQEFITPPADSNLWGIRMRRNWIDGTVRFEKLFLYAHDPQNLSTTL